MKAIQITSPSRINNLVRYGKQGDAYTHLQQTLTAQKALYGQEAAWFIRVECVTDKHDKFYEVGEDSSGFYIRHGRNGTQGKRMEHPSFYSVKAKLEEKLHKRGYCEVRTLTNPYGTESLEDAYQREVVGAAVHGQAKPWTFDGILAMQDNGEDMPVDLSGINAMLTIVKAVRYIEKDSIYKGINADGKVIMTIPHHVTKHEGFISAHDGYALPPTGDI